MKLTKSHLNCECGRPYPKKLLAQEFWTPAADADLMRLRALGTPYRAIEVEINKRHAITVNWDEVYRRYTALCEQAAIARPSESRSRTRPSKPKALYKYADAPSLGMRHSNSCADPFCTKQRANGYDKCLAHLPPLEITKGETP